MSERLRWIAPREVVTGVISILIAQSLLPLVPGEWLATHRAAAFGLLVLLAWIVIATWSQWRACGYSTYPPDSLEYGIHLRLRDRLGDGAASGSTVRTVRSVYVQLLGATLDAVDRFFGDADPPKQSRVARLLGLRALKPLWSAAAYDRCLLLAVIYPILAIFVFWWLSGQQGAAGAAVGLVGGVAGWRRSIVVGLVGGLGVWLFGITRLMRQRRNFPSRGSSAVVAVAVALASAGAGAVAVTVVLSGAVVISGSVVGVGVVPGVVVLFISGAFVGAGSAALAGAFAGAFSVLIVVVGTFDMFVAASVFRGGAIVVAVAGVVAAGVVGTVAVIGAAWSRRRGWSGVFHFAVTLVLLFASEAAPLFLAKEADWPAGGPVLLFVSLLALVNAPFDWLSLGLTRALLRLGLERGGLAPVLFAVYDALGAALVIFMLAVATLLAVQTFTSAEVLGGGKPTLDVVTLLASLADPATRWQPQHWWLFITLFSTLVPSVVNLALASFSLLRGSRRLNRWLLALMPEPGKTMLPERRLLVATGIAVQPVFGAVTGPTLMFGLCWLIFFWFWPLVGGGLLAMLQHLAGMNLPAHVLNALLN